MSGQSSVEPEPPEAPIWVTEPFRIFFPLGIAASILGVLIWPLFYAGAWPFPPPLQHPRLMIFGFGCAFVTGFLGTAWPRFLDGKPLHLFELIALVFTWAVAMVFHAINKLPLGDAATAIHTLTLVGILSLRLGRGRPLPPPGFALAFFSAVMVSVVALLWGFGGKLMTPKIYLFTKLIAWQGFLIFPLLGVGSYLFPRFFQQPEKPPPMATPRQRMTGVWLGALLILISFGIEAMGWIKTGNTIRFFAVAIWMFLAAPALFRGKAPNTRAWALRLVMGSVALSFLVRGFWPGPAYAIEHILFLGGFGLAMLLIADRVSIGHGGDISLLPAKSKTWRWIAWLALITAATRSSADMKVSIQVSHYIYASILWAIILILWTVSLARFWKQSDDSDS